MILMHSQATQRTSALVISANLASLNLRTWALANGWDGAIALLVTINSGVDVGPTTVSGAFPSGVKLINNGLIYGPGGGGGVQGVGAQNGGAGAPGGVALEVTSATTITNNGSISGGGGGGGGGAGALRPDLVILQGGPGGASPSGVGGTGDVGYGGTYAGNGGGAGSLGVAGSTGGPSVSWDIYPGGYAGGPGGGVGGAVTGNSNITWLATGTRTGSIT